MSKPMAKDGAVIWCDRGWQPVYFGFCPSRKAWSREMRKMGAKEPYPTSDGCAVTFEKDGKVCIIVTLGGATNTAARTRVEIAGLLCHEATHIWQKVRQVMAEREPSIEFEAYAMQAIFQGLYQAWLDSVAPDEMLSRGAKIIKRAAA